MDVRQTTLTEALRAPQIMSTYLHGGDPLAGLRINAMVERLRAEMAADPDFWQRVIRERFVENQHNVGGP